MKPAPGLRRPRLGILAGLALSSGALAVACEQLVGLGPEPVLAQEAGADGGPTTRDGSVSDSNASDVGPSDGPLSDANAPDVGTSDGAIADANASDVATPDGSNAEASVPDAASSDADAPDAAIDSGPPCDPSAAFGTPVLLPALNDLASDNYDARLTADELTVYFSRAALTSNNLAGLLVYTASRESATDDFGAPAALAAINPGYAQSQCAPSITADGLSLFLDQIDGQFAGIYVATRQSPDASLGLPTAVPAFPGGQFFGDPIVTPDGTSLYLYMNDSSGTVHVAASQRGEDGGFSPPAIISELAIGGDGVNPAVSPDQLTLYFASSRGGDDGGSQDMDIWVSTRSNVGQAWGAPVSVPNVNSTSGDFPTWVSADGCRLYIESGRPSPDVNNSIQLYLASRPH